jgi:hypothetical protein
VQPILKLGGSQGRKTTHKVAAVAGPAAFFLLRSAHSSLGRRAGWIIAMEQQQPIFWPHVTLAMLAIAAYMVLVAADIMR